MTGVQTCALPICGHNIPTDTIIRRYFAGLKNFINLYKDKVNYWMLIDNSGAEPELIAEGRNPEEYQIVNVEKWTLITKIVSNDTN